jgi:hypothetical protein
MEMRLGACVQTLRCIAELAIRPFTSHFSPTSILHLHVFDTQWPVPIFPVYLCASDWKAPPNCCSSKSVLLTVSRLSVVLHIRLHK